MSGIMLINSRRKRQPYLINPVNPWRKLTIKKHSFAEFADAKTGRFTHAPSWALKRKPGLKHKRNTRKGHKAVLRKRHIRRHKISAPRLSLSDIKAMERQMKTLGGLGRKHSKKGAKTMKRRTHRKHRRSTRRNPFTLKGIIPQKDVLVEGSLIVGGMIGTKLVMDFAARKIAFLATPWGKIAGKLGVAFLANQSGRFIGKKYSTPLALGVIVSAVADVAEIVLPKIGYTGGVKMLSAGYMPDVQAYMPDVQGGEFNFSE